MKLIVGLGNPGKRYTSTRHNIGFMVIEELAKTYNIKLRSSHRFKVLKTEGVMAHRNCYLAMPQNFMNLSGHSVRSLVNWLKIDISDLLLIIDDICLPFGRIRIRSKGSDGGHKGLRSVIDCLGTGGFSRMRIGVKGREHIKDLSKYVLDRFTKKEQCVLPEILKRCSMACECWVKEGANTAMNKFN